MNNFNTLLTLSGLKEHYGSPPVGICTLYNGKLDKSIVESKTGNPIVVPPYKAITSLNISFSPQQAGTGDPSPENIRPISGWDEVTVNVRGKNLLAYSGEVVIPQNIYALPIKDSELGSAIKQLPRDIQLVMTANWSYYTESSTYKTIILYEEGLTNSIKFKDGEPVTIPKNYNIDTIFMYCGDNKTQDCIVSNIQFEAGSTPTPYVPYQGDTYDIALPETVYGGTVDAVTGVGSKEWGFIASYNGESLPGEWISDRDVYVSGTTPTTGAQVAYKLTTPEPFNVNPISIPSLSEINTIYSDADNLSCDFKISSFWSDAD